MLDSLSEELKHTRAFEHDGADVFKVSTNRFTNPHHVHLGGFVDGLRHIGSFFMIPELVELRASILILCAGNDKIAR